MRSFVVYPYREEFMREEIFRSTQHRKDFLLHYDLGLEDRLQSAMVKMAYFDSEVAAEAWATQCASENPGITFCVAPITTAFVCPAGPLTKSKMSDQGFLPV